MSSHPLHSDFEVIPHSLLADHCSLSVLPVQGRYSSYAFVQVRSGRPGVRGKHIHYSRRVFLLDLEKYVFEVNQVRIWANTYFREVHEF